MLGIDFGSSRIGVAVSDELGLLAHPVETIPAAPGEKAAKRVAEIVREKNASRVIVGLPKHMKGTLGESAKEALAFAEKLRALVPCEVVMLDERLTTLAANRALRDAGQKTHKSRAFVDQVAAQMILQGYLDGLQNAPGPLAEE